MNRKNKVKRSKLNAGLFSRDVGSLVPPAFGYPWLKVVHSERYESCQGCYWEKKKIRGKKCIKHPVCGLCNKNTRKDHTDVIFKRLSFFEYWHRYNEAMKVIKATKKALERTENHDNSI